MSTPHVRGSSPDSRLRRRPEQIRPRICGNLPWSCIWLTFNGAAAPHMRRCSPAQRGDLLSEPALPAYAGIFPAQRRSVDVQAGLPYICRDIPVRMLSPYRTIMSALHMQGYTVRSTGQFGGNAIRPAYAGIFPSWTASKTCPQSPPRTCGDVPRLWIGGSEAISPTPPVRG